MASRRGFASMDKDKLRAICRQGGIIAHQIGKAHEFTSEKASSAARPGHVRGTAHQFTREEAREAGRKGGMARAARRRALLATAAPVAVPT